MVRKSPPRSPLTDKLSVRRGLTEGLVILASILIAFWIDAWWDERQAAGMEGAMLEAVVEEMARNRASLGETVSRLEADLDRIDRFLRASEQALLALPQDSVEAWLGALNGRASFNGDLEATSMLLQTPALDSQESLAVRGRLGSWRNLIDEAELLGGQLDQEQIMVRRLIAAYGARVGTGGAAPAHAMAARLGPSGLVEMRNDEALVATVISKRDAQATHLRFLRRAIDQVTDLSDSVAALVGR